MGTELNNQQCVQGRLTVPAAAEPGAEPVWSRVLPGATVKLPAT